MYICGSGSFGEGDDINMYKSSSTTPKRTKRSTSFCKILGRDNSIKNPYADRGLDKFYSLLSDLNDKKQKIYTERGSEDISFVRFVYANDSKNVKPIVVRVKEEKKNEKKKISSQSSSIEQLVIKSDKEKNLNPVAQNKDEEKEVPKQNGKMMKKRSLTYKQSFKLENLKKSNICFPLVIILILLFLGIYGRSFAIMCTTIGCYLIPSMIVEKPPAKTNRKKLEYVKILSEKKIVHQQSQGPSSPTSVLNNCMR